MVAYWGRPEAYLDPAVRSGTSAWKQLSPEVVERVLEQLQADLLSGAWDQRYGHLRDQEALDVGLRLVCWELQHTSP
jgi:hypothetical protein